MDTTDSATNAAAAGIMGGVILVVVIITCALAVFFVWLFWRIFAKTGMNGALGLLCLVPYVGPLICLLILAFGQWPIDRRARGTRGRIMPPPPPPPAAPPPGSSVMPTLGPQLGDPAFDGRRFRGQDRREILGARRRNGEVVFDPDADPAEALGHGPVVGLKVQPGFDRQHHPLAQRAVSVFAGASARAVVHVDPEHVADVVQRVAPVRRALRIEQLVERAVAMPRSIRPWAKTRIARRFGSKKVVAGSDRLDGRRAALPRRCRRRRAARAKTSRKPAASG